MTRIITHLLIIIFLSGCSVNPKSNFWQKKDENTSKSKEIELFKEKKSFSKEFNSNIKISLNENFQKNSFINNITNSHKIINYDGKFQIQNKFKFKKINNFKSAKPEIHITQKKDIIIFDGKGSILKLNENFETIWKKNFYSKKEKKLDLLLNFGSYNNSLIITDNLSNIYSVDLTSGELQWTKKNKSSFNSEIKIKQSRIYAVDFENVVYCISLENGKILWEYKSDNTLIKSTANVSLVIHNNKMIFINTLGDINALNLEDGSLIWQTPTQSSSVVEDSFSINYSDLVLENNNIFILNNKNEFFNIRVENGAVNWIQNISSNIKPVVLKNIAFIISNDGFFFVIDNRNGSIIRSTDIKSSLKNYKKGTNFNGFIVGKNKIYLSTNEGKILIINILNGKVENINKINKTSISSPYIINKKMYILSMNSITKYN